MELTEPDAILTSTLIMEAILEAITNLGLESFKEESIPLQEEEESIPHMSPFREDLFTMLEMGPEETHTLCTFFIIKFNRGRNHERRQKKS